MEFEVTKKKKKLWWLYLIIALITLWLGLDISFSYLIGPMKDGVAYTLSEDKTYYTCDVVFLVEDLMPKKVVIPSKTQAYFGKRRPVKKIGQGAFYFCGKMTSVVIPKTITTIGPAAFEGCNNLKNVYISDLAAWCAIEFEGKYNTNPLEYAENLYVNNELVTELVIPDGVTEISAYAFYRYKNLTSVTIPKSVKKIGEEAFAECENLTSVTILGDATQVGEFAFSGCTNLMNVTVGAEVNTIE